MELKLDFYEIFLRHFKTIKNHPQSILDNTTLQRYSQMIINLNPQIIKIIWLDKDQEIFVYNPVK